jgi:hypothetical protein
VQQDPQWRVSSSVERQPIKWRWICRSATRTRRPRSQILVPRRGYRAMNLDEIIPEAMRAATRTVRPRARERPRRP